MDTIDCIDNTTWEKYAKGELTDEAIGQLVEHASSCEICADIKEGIDAMKQPAMLVERVREINKAVDKRTTRKVIPLNRWYITLAASLLLVTGLTWYLTKPKAPQNIAMVQEVIVPPKEKKPISPQPAELKKPEKTNQAAPKRTKAPIIANPPVTQADDTKVAEETTQDFNGGGVQEEERIAESNEPSSDAIPEQQVTKALSERSIKEATVPRQEIVIKEQTVEKRKSKNYKLANKNQIASKQKSTVEYERNKKRLQDKYNQIDSIRFFNATNHFNTGVFDSCTLELLPISFEPSSPYYESGLLLLAKAYLRLNESDKAMPYLQRVVNLNGKYRKEAQELLNNK